jgi:hypothetical protein
VERWNLSGDEFNHMTRLETRTKEFDSCASVRQRMVEVEMKSITIIHITIHKYDCQDPKDGELYLGRMKSEETLMEVRTNTDVQIV